MKDCFCMLKIKKIYFFLSFLLIFQYIHCIDYFEEGKKFLLADMPDKAASALFAASGEADSPKDVYLYLGIACLRMGKYNEAINYLTAGRKNDTINSYLYSYNIGNIYFLQSRFDAAEQAYNDSISYNGLYAPSFLNRANSRMKLNKFEGALQDYKIYLNLKTDSPQEDSIRQIISLLETVTEEAEKARLLVEARKAIEEAERTALAEKYGRLIEEINSNLSSVNDTDSISAGADETIDYSEDNELD